MRHLIPATLLLTGLVFQGPDALARESGSRDGRQGEAGALLTNPRAPMRLALDPAVDAFRFYVQASQPGSESFQVDQGTTFLDWGPYAFLGFTIASAATTAITGGLFFKHRADMSHEVRGTRKWRDYRDSVEAEAIATDVLFVVTGAALVTTIVLFLVRGDSEDTTQIYGE